MKQLVEDAYCCVKPSSGITMAELCNKLTTCVNGESPTGIAECGVHEPPGRPQDAPQLLYHATNTVPLNFPLSPSLPSLFFFPSLFSPIQIHGCAKALSFKSVVQMTHS